MERSLARVMTCRVFTIEVVALLSAFARQPPLAAESGRIDTAVDEVLIDLGLPERDIPELIIHASLDASGKSSVPETAKIPTAHRKLDPLVGPRVVLYSRGASRLTRWGALRVATTIDGTITSAFMFA